MQLFTRLLGQPSRALRVLLEPAQLRLRVAAKPSARPSHESREHRPLAAAVILVVAVPVIPELLLNGIQQAGVSEPEHHEKRMRSVWTLDRNGGSRRLRN